MILNRYLYGSRLYGTNDNNSDYDYILISDDKLLDNTKDKDDNQIYYIDTFQELLFNMNIKALECYFMPSKFKSEAISLKYVFDKSKLRKEISKTSSNSFIKTKKKLIVSEDYNLRIGLKSFYHSIRILDYGIQIAKYGKIKYWNKYNHILLDLYKLSRSYHYDFLWEEIKRKYKPLYNKLKSKLRKLT